MCDLAVSAHAMAGFCKGGNCVLGCQSFDDCPDRNTYSGSCNDGVCYYSTGDCVTSQFDLDGFETNGCEYNPTTSGTAVSGLIIYQHCGFEGWSITLSEGLFNLGEVGEQRGCGHRLGAVPRLQQACKRLAMPGRCRPLRPTLAACPVRRPMPTLQA